MFTWFDPSVACNVFPTGISDCLNLLNEREREKEREREREKEKERENKLTFSNAFENTRNTSSI